jgi:hypothetical protein
MWNTVTAFYVIHALMKPCCIFSLNASSVRGIGLELNSDYDIYKMILDAKERYLFPFLMEIPIIGCCSIWDQRNDYIFNNKIPYVAICITRFKYVFHINL